MQQGREPGSSSRPARGREFAANAGAGKEGTYHVVEEGLDERLGGSGGAAALSLVAADGVERVDGSSAIAIDSTDCEKELVRNPSEEGDGEAALKGEREEGRDLRITYA